MKRIILSILSILIFVLFASCDEMGGETEHFNSVYVFATYEEGAYSSDVVVKEDTDDDDTCDTNTYFDDDVIVTLFSTSIDNLSEDVIESDVKIMSYTVSYTARDEESPGVPTKIFLHGLILEPDTETEIPVRIIDIEDKAYSSTHPLNYFDYYWSGAIQYEYTVTVRFKIEEVLSGRRETVKVEFPLYYYDIADECTPS